MLEVLLMLIALAVAAWVGGVGRLFASLWGSSARRRRQAGRTWSGPLAVLLRCVHGGPRPALVAALARPAPVGGPPLGVGPYRRLSSPHGLLPGVDPDPQRMFGPPRRA